MLDFIAERVSLIAGASRGLGRAIAERLARRGDEVALLASTPTDLDATASELREAGARVLALSADVRDVSAVSEAVRRLIERTGRLDGVVHAAGRFRGYGPLGKTEGGVWWEDIETALRGAESLALACLPSLKASNRASFVSLVGPGFNGELAYGSGYAAAQAGLVKLTECWAEEWKGEDIACYAVFPGLVPTALMNRLLDDPVARRWLPRFTEAFAEGKEVGPEFVAEMVAWLTEERPVELRGRVVHAPTPPELLALRLERIAAEDRGKLRLT